MNRCRLPLAVLAGMLAGWLFTAAAQPTAAGQLTLDESVALSGIRFELQNVNRELQLANIELRDLQLITLELRQINDEFTGGSGIFDKGVRDLLEDIEINTR